jgi:mono/diheme cytochrome c family protein
MKNRMLKLLMAIVIAIGFMGCGSSGSKKETVSAVETVKSTEKHVGELAYKRHCNACHQKDAGGIPGMYPPLANNKVISGDKKPLIDIVLNGMSGEIEVNGEKYNGVMASYRNLSDKEIADVLNYLRTGFGNSGDEILPNEVKELR